MGIHNALGAALMSGLLDWTVVSEGQLRVYYFRILQIYMICSAVNSRHSSIGDKVICAV